MSRQLAFFVRAGLGIAVLTLSTASLLSREGEDALSRFKREAPKGWAQLEEMEAGLEFVVRVTETRENAKRPDDRQKEYVATWRRRPGCLLVERADVKTGQVVRRTVVAANEQYEFSARQSGKEGDSWQLRMFRMRKPQDADSNYFLVYQAHLFPLTSILNNKGQRFSEMMNDPAFHLKEAESKDGRVVLRTQYTPKKGAPIRGEIAFDPAMKWAVREYRLTDGKTINISRKADFTERLIGQYRVPARIITEYRRSPDSSVVYLQRKAEFESVRKCSSSPEEFRLSAYNLPEPPGVERPATSRRSLLAVCALVCGALTALFWWLARRKKVRHDVEAG
jgi:hypothetical protein